MGVTLLAVRNLVKAALAAAVACTLLGLIGWALRDGRLALICVFAGLLAATGVYIAGERIIMGLVGGRELLLAEAPVLHTLVEGLALRAGVVKPRLYVIADGHPRALSAGRGPNGSAIAVSRALLQACPPAELEGVIAHEIAHIRTRDVTVQTAAVILGSTLYDVARLGGFLERSVRFVTAPLAAAIVHALLSPKRELQADRLAAEWCGTPHGLAEALIRLEQASELVGFDASPVTSPLWTIDPFPPAGPSALFATHPPVCVRVAALRALDPGWRDRLRSA